MWERVCGLPSIIFFAHHSTHLRIKAFLVKFQAPVPNIKGLKDIAKIAKAFMVLVKSKLHRGQTARNVLFRKLLAAAFESTRSRVEDLIETKKYHQVCYRHTSNIVVGTRPFGSIKSSYAHLTLGACYTDILLAYQVDHIISHCNSCSPSSPHLPKFHHHPSSHSLSTGDRQGARPGLGRWLVGPVGRG